MILEKTEAGRQQTKDDGVKEEKKRKHEQKQKANKNKCRLLQD